jgi:hypothetical protein
MILLIEAVGIGSSAFFSSKTVPVVASTRMALRDAVSIEKAPRLDKPTIKSANRTIATTRKDVIDDSMQCLVFIFFRFNSLQALEFFKRLCVLLTARAMRHS